MSFTIAIAVFGIVAQNQQGLVNEYPGNGKYEPEPEISSKLKKSSDDPTKNLISASTYGFAAAGSVGLEDMSTGTTLLVGPGLDDNASVVSNIGFNFIFDGVIYSQFSVNANGLAKLGPVAVTTAFANDLANVTNAPKIAPYFEDLCTGTNGKVHYKVVGSAPNRKLVVEWQNMQVTRGSGCGGAGTGTFQMWLFESMGSTTPGPIQFVYGTLAASNTADAGASIGIQSGAATNFASVTTAGNTVSYTVSNNLNASGLAAGTSYVFTPTVVPTEASNNGSVANPTSVTLN